MIFNSCLSYLCVTIADSITYESFITNYYNKTNTKIANINSDLFQKNENVLEPLHTYLLTHLYTNKNHFEWRLLKNFHESDELLFKLQLYTITQSDEKHDLFFKYYNRLNTAFRSANNIIQIIKQQPRGIPLNIEKIFWLSELLIIDDIDVEIEAIRNNVAYMPLFKYARSGLVNLYKYIGRLNDGWRDINIIRLLAEYFEIRFLYKIKVSMMIIYSYDLRND